MAGDYRMAVCTGFLPWGWGEVSLAPLAIHLHGLNWRRDVRLLASQGSSCDLTHCVCAGGFGHTAPQGGGFSAAANQEGGFGNAANQGGGFGAFASSPQGGGFGGMAHGTSPFTPPRVSQNNLLFHVCEETRSPQSVANHDCNCFT